MTMMALGLFGVFPNLPAPTFARIERRKARPRRKLRMADIPIGATFGRLTVLARVQGVSVRNHAVYRTRCECGRITEKVGDNLTKGVRGGGPWGGGKRPMGCTLTCPLNNRNHPKDSP